MVERGRRATDDITRHMRFACCITEVTDIHTHSECVIVVFPRQHLVINALRSYNSVMKRTEKKKSANFRKMSTSHLNIPGARKVT